MSHNETDSGESKLGLDRNPGVGEKLFQTLVLLVLGGFLAIFTTLVLVLVVDAWASFAAQTALEICWVFWFLALVFIWWRPRWLRVRYLRAEARMVSLGTVLKFAAGILFIIAVVLVTYLVQIGVLPLDPK